MRQSARRGPSIRSPVAARFSSVMVSPSSTLPAARGRVAVDLPRGDGEATPAELAGGAGPDLLARPVEERARARLQLVVEQRDPAGRGEVRDVLVGAQAALIAQGDAVLLGNDEAFPDAIGLGL